MQIRLSFLHQLHVHTNVFCLLLHILLCDMGVDVHCSREIGMPHDLLNEFNIVGAFAEPGTEGVPQVVNTTRCCSARNQITLNNNLDSMGDVLF